jgi:DNA-binding NarL/FixJ family response regulator
MRLLVVEDEPHWQATIERIIAENKNLELIGVCANLADALAQIRSVEYDMLIVDLGLPDGSGIGAIRTSRRLRPDADILVATVFDDERSVVAAICAGATGYLVKDSTPQEWISAIQQLREGHSPLSPKVARHILRTLQVPSRGKRIGLPLDGDRSPNAAISTDPDENVSLSARETEVLQLVAKGFSLVEVAQFLHVSHTTTRTHAKNIYRKLEVSSRGEAVFEATRLGLL